MTNDERQLLDDAIGLIQEASDAHENHEHETGQDKLDEALTHLNLIRGSLTAAARDEVGGWSEEEWG